MHCAQFEHHDNSHTDGGGELSQQTQRMISHLANGNNASVVSFDSDEILGGTKTMLLFVL